MIRRGDFGHRGRRHHNICLSLSSLIMCSCNYKIISQFLMLEFLTRTLVMLRDCEAQASCVPKRSFKCFFFVRNVASLWVYYRPQPNFGCG